jgi:hypothetical protein
MRQSVTRGTVTVTVSVSGSAVMTTAEHIISKRFVSPEITEITVVSGRKKTMERDGSLVKCQSSCKS